MAGSSTTNYLARLLRLNHTALKEKVEISKQENPAFVEIPFSDELSPVHWTGEMDNASKGEGAIPALVEMGKAFWGHDQ